MRSQYAVKNQEIINYYNSSRADYQLYNFSRTDISLHFGLWDENTYTPKQALLNENRFLVQLGKITADDYVIDLGCGCGAVAVWLATQIGCRVVGITLGTEQVETARRLAKREGVDHLTTFIDMDFHEVAYQEAVFDVVIAVESICHSNNKKGVLEECYRVLKPGGRLVIADSYFNKSKNTFTPNEQKMISYYLGGVHIPDLSERQEFEHYLGNAHFSKIRWFDKTSFVLPILRKLQRIAKVFLPLSAMLGWFRINALNSGHLKAFINQYYTLRKGMVVYGFFSAEKPKISSHE